MNANNCPKCGCCLLDHYDDMGTFTGLKGCSGCGALYRILLKLEEIISEVK